MNTQVIMKSANHLQLTTISVYNYCWNISRDFHKFNVFFKYPVLSVIMPDESCDP